MTAEYRPTIGITLGDPAGIGPEVIVKALADPVLRHKAKYVIYGMNELLAYAADLAEFDVFWWRDQFSGRLRSYPHDVVVVDYDQYSILGHAVRIAEQDGRRSVDALLSRCDRRGPEEDHRRGRHRADRQGKLEAGGLSLSRPYRTVRPANRSAQIRDDVRGGPLKVVLATVHIGLNSLWGRLNIGAVFHPIELIHEGAG